MLFTSFPLSSNWDLKCYIYEVSFTLHRVHCCHLRFFGRALLTRTVHLKCNNLPFRDSLIFILRSYSFLVVFSRLSTWRVITFICVLLYIKSRSCLETMFFSLFFSYVFLQLPTETFHRLFVSFPTGNLQRCNLNVFVVAKVDLDTPARDEVLRAPLLRKLLRRCIPGACSILPSHTFPLNPPFLPQVPASKTPSVVASFPATKLG